MKQVETRCEKCILSSSLDETIKKDLKKLTNALDYGDVNETVTLRIVCTEQAVKLFSAEVRKIITNSFVSQQDETVAMPVLLFATDTDKDTEHLSNIFRSDIHQTVTLVFITNYQNKTELMPHIPSDALCSAVTPKDNCYVKVDDLLERFLFRKLLSVVQLLKQVQDQSK